MSLSSASHGSLDGLVGGFPVLPTAAAQGVARSKAAVRKLESTVSFLTAELASEVKCKQELIASLARSEEAVAKVKEDTKATVVQQQAKFNAEVAELKQVMKAAVDAKQMEVSPSSLSWPLCSCIKQLMTAIMTSAHQLYCSLSPPAVVATC